MTGTPIQLPPGHWTLLDEPRVPPASRESLGPVAKAVLWLARRKTNEDNDFNVFLTLARLGRIFPAHSLLVSQLLGKTRLRKTEKELVVLRVAWRLGCVYEYAHHRRMAEALGVPAELIAAATTEDLTSFDPRTAALLKAADDVVAQHTLSGAGWARLTEVVSPDEALELVMFVGHYVMVAGVINTVGIQPEPEFAVHTTGA